MQLTPQVARQVLKGEVPLRTLLGVSPQRLLQMAAEGHELWKQGRRQDARQMFQALVAVDDSLYYGHAGLGLAAMQEEDFTAAHKHLSRALELEPADASVAVNLGEVLLRLGQLPEAVAMMETAVKLDPTAKHPGAKRAAAILAGIGEGISEMTKTAAVK